MNTENSKTNEPHKFRLTLADKLNLKDPNKNMALTNLSIYNIWKNIKTLRLHITTVNLNYLLQLGLVSLICLMDHFLFQTYKIILSTLLKSMKL